MQRSKPDSGSALVTAASVGNSLTQQYLTQARGDIGKALAPAHSMVALARLGEHAQLEALARQFQARLLGRLRDAVSMPVALAAH